MRKLSQNLTVMGATAAFGTLFIYAISAKGAVTFSGTIEADKARAAASQVLQNAVEVAFTERKLSVKPSNEDARNAAIHLFAKSGAEIVNVGVSSI